MDLGLDGKVALVTAASSGLGLASARALAGEGAKVAICARDTVKLEAARQAIENDVGDGRVVARSVDVTDLDACGRFIDFVVGHYGQLDIAIINTGGPAPGPASGFEISSYREAMETVTLPAIGISQLVIPHVRKNGCGRIVFITSETIRQPTQKYALSGISRTGIASYAKSIAGELAGRGVTVNVLAPGYHRTPALEGQFVPADRRRELQKIAQTIPLRRLGDAEDFGAIAAFLAGRHAAFITGTVQLVDGGLTKCL